MWKTEEHLSIIVAVDHSGGFAKNGEIPWNYPEDWEHFKSTTDGHVCIMGRKTYEDIVDRKRSKFEELLPGRRSFIISSTLAGKDLQGVEGVYTSTRQVLDELKLPEDDPTEIYILGGYRLFIQHLATAKQIWMTIVPGYHECDRHFPVDKLDDFSIVEGREEGDLKFVRYSRNITWYRLHTRDMHLMTRVQMHFMGKNVIEETNPQRRTIVVNALTREEHEALELAGVTIREINKPGV